jgi:hypothetical protein
VVTGASSGLGREFALARLSRSSPISTVAGVETLLGT